MYKDLLDENCVDDPRPNYRVHMRFNCDMPSGRGTRVAQPTFELRAINTTSGMSRSFSFSSPISWIGGSSPLVHSLIDCGCSPHGFLDATFAQRENVPLGMLSTPRNLRLARTSSMTVSVCGPQGYFVGLVLVSTECTRNPNNAKHQGRGSLLSRPPMPASTPL